MEVGDGVVLFLKMLLHLQSGNSNNIFLIIVYSCLHLSGQYMVCNVLLLILVSSLMVCDIIKIYLSSSHL